MTDQVATPTQDGNQGSAAQMAADIDTGGRNPTGALKNLIPALCFVWAVFQIFYSSNVPFWLVEATGINLILNNSDSEIFLVMIGTFSQELH